MKRTAGEAIFFLELLLILPHCAPYPVGRQQMFSVGLYLTGTPSVGHTSSASVFSSGHFSMLQLLMIFSPLQHLVMVWVPPPQLTEHSLHTLQGLNPKSLNLLRHTPLMQVLVSFASHWPTGRQVRDSTPRPQVTLHADHSPQVKRASAWMAPKTVIKIAAA